MEFSIPAREIGGVEIAFLLIYHVTFHVTFHIVIIEKLRLPRGGEESICESSNVDGRGTRVSFSLVQDVLYGP